MCGDPAERSSVPPARTDRGTRDRLLARREDLDRDGAIEPRVAGLVDFAHATRAEWRLNFVRPKPVPAPIAMLTSSR